MVFQKATKMDKVLQNNTARHLDYEDERIKRRKCIKLVHFLIFGWKNQPIIRKHPPGI